MQAETSRLDTTWPEIIIINGAFQFSSLLNFAKVSKVSNIHFLIL